MTYHPPESVDSPRGRWRLMKVLWNSGDGGAALALGLWDGEPCLAMRWNGQSRTSGVGSPQSRGLPTWFILPNEFKDAILSAPVIQREMVDRANTLFELYDEADGA